MKNTQLGQTLGHDYQAIHELLKSLESAVTTNDHSRVTAALSELEARLRHHIEGEERFLFSPFERRHPIEIAQLRREHRQLLQTLEELKVDAELHALSKDRINDFIEALQCHAEREDGAAYQWAARLPHETKPSMARFLANLRSGAEPSGPDEA